MKLKTLKAERDYWTNKLSKAESKEAKKVIEETLDELNYKIEDRIARNQWLFDIASSTVGIMVGAIIYDRLKK